MILYCHTITPRLQYITDFIGKEIFGKPIELTTEAGVFSSYVGPKINYSHTRINNEEPARPAGGLRIKNCSLLFENSIKEQSISCFETNDFKTFFKTDGDYPFDIFAASFYLLSRYEEYLPHKKDMYGRYAHENSLAFKEGILNIPLINVWLEDFKMVLKEKFSMLNILPIAIGTMFKFEPTYDIDEAYAFKNKSLFRNVGGIIKSIVNACLPKPWRRQGEWAKIKERLKVMSGNNNDPYDSYEWIDALHERLKLKPIYFFHVALKKGKYDKNIPPSHPAMQQLIKHHTEKYPIGIHPSWKSGDEESLLEKEIQMLESISRKKITSSRQHYIRVTLPHTFRRLIEAGITDDYSMGYGSINGFRASVASTFYWYDLEKDQQTNLLLHPFCFMEANSFFEQKYTPQQAAEELKHYYEVVKSVNGTFISIWHNNFLGTHKLFTGWREVYEEFISSL